MENKIGYAVITTNEYREIIEDNLRKEECIKELNTVNREEYEINERFKEYFFKSIINREEYHFKNMKECKPTDYHYQELYRCFLKIGIDNVKYIHRYILNTKQLYDEGLLELENEEESEE